MMINTLQIQKIQIFFYVVCFYVGYPNVEIGKMIGKLHCLVVVRRNGCYVDGETVKRIIT